MRTPFNCSPKKKCILRYFVNGKIMKNWNTNRNSCLFHCSFNDEMNESHLSDAKNMHRSNKSDFVILSRAWQYTHFTSCESQHYTKVCVYLWIKWLCPFSKYLKKITKKKKKYGAHIVGNLKRVFLMFATFPIIHFTLFFL